MKRFLLFLLGGAACLGCAHSSFEACVRQHAELLAASRVQAAIACQGDHACIEQGVIDDVQLFAGMAEQCKMDSLDGGK